MQLSVFDVYHGLLLLKLLSNRRSLVFQLRYLGHNQLMLGLLLTQLAIDTLKHLLELCNLLAEIFAMGALCFKLLLSYLDFLVSLLGSIFPKLLRSF